MMREFRMRKLRRAGLVSVAGICAMVSLGSAAGAETASGVETHGHGHGHDHAQEHSHDHNHDHSHSHDDIRRGIFDDAQVQPRALSDWQGDWQSVYPYLQDGTLDPVWAQKAQKTGAASADVRAEYEIGYQTEISGITIAADQVSFLQGESRVSGTYVEDGLEILTYPKGNRGVRFVFKKTAGDAAAPSFIQFSDHEIAPVQVGHYHLYWGDDRAALLQELTHWPTYYPAAMRAQQILDEMLAH